MTATRLLTSTTVGSGGFVSGALGANIAAATTIAPTDFAHVITGTGTVQTITAPIPQPHILIFFSQDGFSLTSGGNYLGAVTSVPANQTVELLYDGTNYHDNAVKPSALSLPNVPAGNISSTTIQDAINELDTEKVAKAGDTMSGLLTFSQATETVQSRANALGSMYTAPAGVTAPVGLSLSRGTGTSALAGSMVSMEAKLKQDGAGTFAPYWFASRVYGSNDGTADQPAFYNLFGYITSQSTALPGATLHDIVGVAGIGFAESGATAHTYGGYFYGGSASPNGIGVGVEIDTDNATGQAPARIQDGFTTKSLVVLALAPTDTTNGNYTAGTVTATNGSATVTGVIPAIWNNTSMAGKAITIAGVGYTVNAVTTAGNGTTIAPVLTTTVNYAGTTGGGKSYSIAVGKQPSSVHLLLQKGAQAGTGMFFGKNCNTAYGIDFVTETGADADNSVAWASGFRPMRISNSKPLVWRDSTNAVDIDTIQINASNNLVLNTASSASFVFTVNGTTVSTLNSTGQLALGTTGTPNTTLDVNGPVAMRRSLLSLVNGLNSNIATPANSFVKITGPTGAFSLGGFTGGVDGRILYVCNGVAQTMTIVNADASSSAANRIVTLTGANVVLRAGTSFATFIYDGGGSTWALVATN